MALTKDQVRKLRETLQRELDKVSIGFKLTLGNASYLDDTVTFKLECGRIDAAGNVETKEAAQFRRYCGMYGLQADDLGKGFHFQGQHYIITGLNPRCRKMPILTKCKGHNFKLSEKAVLKALGRTLPEWTPEEILAQEG